MLQSLTRLMREGSEGAARRKVLMRKTPDYAKSESSTASFAEKDTALRNVQDIQISKPPSNITKNCQTKKADTVVECALASDTTQRHVHGMQETVTILKTSSFRTISFKFDLVQTQDQFEVFIH